MEELVSGKLRLHGQFLANVLYASCVLGPIAVPLHGC